LLALFCGSSALAGSESAATGKVESVRRQSGLAALNRIVGTNSESAGRVPDTADMAGKASFRPDTISPAGAQGIAQFMRPGDLLTSVALPIRSIPKKQYQNRRTSRPTSSSVSGNLGLAPPPTMPELPVWRTGSPTTAICRPRP